jgi:hypothetical protein
MQYGRRAYGAHRVMSPAAKARNVAASIQAHGYDVEAVGTWQKYGLAENAQQQALVRRALGQAT